MTVELGADFRSAHCAPISFGPLATDPRVFSRPPFPSPSPPACCPAGKNPCTRRTLGPAFAGSGFEKRFVLYVPENGLIALNVPLDPLRLGSFSTRTTHPFYIARWNELLKMVGMNGH